ncbi:DUF6603 domain-containing protein [Streptomyces sp. NPDC059122]|uniref:DUF6603 domain-containing protein n=1 Tax=Streptomyces sp. NPDC059122 TaxID=3346732 RepID=UPI0036C0BEB0
MAVQVQALRKLLEKAPPGGVLDIPPELLGAEAGNVFPGGALRIEGAVCDPKELRAAGKAASTANGGLRPVRLSFTENGDEITGTLAAVDLGGPHGLVLVDGDAGSAELPPGAWLLTEGRTLPLSVRRPARQTDPADLDGLGRAKPVPRARSTRGRRGPRALVTTDGILVPRRTAVRRKGFTVLESPNVRGWGGIEPPSGDNGISFNYENPPLRIAGALTALPARTPYKTVIGGMLIVDTGTLNGTAMASYVVPESGTRPSFFAYGSLGSEVGFGPPLFQVRGISAGFGWNSRVRVPGAEAIGDFPFLIALDDPGAIGSDDEEVDPLKVLAALVGGSLPWVSPQEGDLWFAAGLAFNIFETIKGRALALVQTGSDLSISLLGAGGGELPTRSNKKIARVEIGVEATLRPVSGELSLGVGLTENTFVIDPDCKLRGGIGLKIWFGDNPKAGDFAFILGAIPANRELPPHYPKQQPAGITWGLGSTVNISGSAYAGLTPKSLMAGGALEVVFQSGMLRAWLTAKVDAFLQWNPFYFDVGVGVRVGVSATIKVWFVRVKISIEVGVSVRVWGPPVGGEATVHLWFISFTIGFGKGRDNTPPPLDWGGFQGMLPAPETMVRTMAGSGLLGEEPSAPRSEGKAWLVDNAGFQFTADSQAPVNKLFLNRTSTTPVATADDQINILPMQETGRDSELRVWLEYNANQDEDLMEWGHEAVRGNVAKSLWGRDTGGDELLRDRILGVKLASPPVDNGTDTGFIDEKAISFDPVRPDGNQPLDRTQAAVGPVPQRTTGVISKISTAVNASTVRTQRAALSEAVKNLGVDLGPVDNDLTAYAGCAATAFTAEPLLIPA